MAAINTYQPGDQVDLDFKDIKDRDGVPFNPATVKWHVKAPGVAVATKTYALADATTVKVQDGWFRYTLTIPYDAASAGYWHVDAQGLDVSDNSLLVQPTDFKVESLATLT